MRSVRLRNTLSRIRKAIPLIIAIKRIKYLGINLTKEVKDWYTINYKTPRKEIKDFATPWTAAYQAPPSMGFSRQEYWSGLPSYLS